MNLGSPVTGYPVTFAVDGRQYIAVSTGSSVSGSGQLALTPEIHVGNSNNLYVFALPEGVQSTGGTPQPLRRNVPAAASAVAVAAAPSCKPKDIESELPVARRISPAGRFSAVQSAAGRKLYAAQQCTTCHGATMGGAPGAPALNDVGFRATWGGHSVNALLDCMRSTMPPGRGGSLSDAQYVSLIAAILESNGFKPGAAAMPTDANELSRIVLGEPH